MRVNVFDVVLCLCMVVYEFDDIIINGENVVMLLFIIVEFEVVFDDDLIVVECD